MFLLRWISCTIQAKHNSQSSNSEMLMGEKYLFSTKFICALDYKNLKYFIHGIFYIENERWVWHLELCFSSPNTPPETTFMIVAVKSTRFEGYAVNCQFVSWLYFQNSDRIVKIHALSLQVESDPLKNIMHVSILKKKKDV